MARKGLTLLPGLVRRPQHLPLGRQQMSPECSTNDSLSNYRIAGLFRTRQVSLPDSTTQRVGPAGQTHFSTSRLTIRYQSLARLHESFNTILHLGITQLTLYIAITFVIQQFPDYIAISGHYYKSTLSHFRNTSALVKNTRQTE